eukprot:TRINITY_DN4439_c0_g1_i1.p1 TRINITY_DN4439_c0_g1~~TRINITY_DN4439_c0_g1_i1.p1  ORF type:complete len:451 (+),score=91.66 TRINITY_DN4439_c0_g1_i1:119-1471(+)
MKALRRAQKQAAIEEVVKRVFTPQMLDKLRYRDKLREEFTFRWQRTFKRLLPLGGASEGNKLTIYNNGDDAFREMWASIDEATTRVSAETYILHPDTIGKKTIEHLTNAASRGCDVKFIFDHLGSKKMNDKHFEALRNAGGEAVLFNPFFTWPWNFKKWLFRNHRKILVVDGKVGYTGGMNIANEYAGTQVGGTGYFRDTHVKVEGPAVKDLEQVFYNSLQEARLLSQKTSEMPKNLRTAVTEMLDRRNAITPIITHPQPRNHDLEGKGVFVQLLQSNVRRNKRHIQKALRLTLREATSHCYLTTPYFLPPNKLKQAIIQAANKGVEIKILTAGLSDVPMVRYASQHIYHLFLRNNVKIYELFGARLHAKTITIDGIYSSIGSFNLDPWSHFYNLEINLTTLDPGVANQLEEHFEKDLETSTQVTLANLEKRSIWECFVHWACYHILRLW